MTIAGQSKPCQRPDLRRRWVSWGVLFVLATSCASSNPPTSPVVVPEDVFPSWSPSGTQLAYIHFDPFLDDGIDSSGLYVLDIGADTSTFVLPGFQRSVDWSPDGTHLLFHDVAGIHTIRVDGDSMTTVYPGGSFPAWSPDGQSIAFDAGGKLWTMKADGAALTMIAAPESVAMRDPDWSSDGIRLVFRYQKTGVPLEEVATVHVDGTRLTRLTYDSVSDLSPTWSPSDSLLAWSRAGHLWTMDTTGAQARPVTPGENPAWDPTGQWLAFAARAGNAMRIFRIRLDGTSLMQLTH